MDDLDKIFRAYDIRGIYPDEINEELAYKIGKAVVKILGANKKNRKIVVGMDSRPSSKKLLEVIIRGINDMGSDVVNIGLSATPVFYYAVKEFCASGGIMITASHNSENYNGFKIVKKNSMPIGTKGLIKIKKLLGKNISNSKETGTVETKEVLKDYIDSILKLGRGDLKPSDLADFSSKFHFTVDFDNDKDRIFFTDENGDKIDPDIISAILIHYCFKDAGKILYTVASSKNVINEAINNENKVVCSRIGHSFIKETMTKEKIVFGSEASGHYYFKETNYFEAPLLVLVRIIEILSETKMLLSELVEKFDKYYRERIEIDISNNKEIDLQIKDIEKKYKKISRSGRLPRISHIDGLSVEYPDFWFNFHLSNTEPVLRLTIEADTQELLAEQKQELLKSIRL